MLSLTDQTAKETSTEVLKLHDAVKRHRLQIILQCTDIDEFTAIARFKMIFLALGKVHKCSPPRLSEVSEYCLRNKSSNICLFECGYCGHYLVLSR